MRAISTAVLFLVAACIVGCHSTNGGTTEVNEEWPLPGWETNHVAR